jgi:hypothetical protein
MEINDSISPDGDIEVFFKMIQMSERAEKASEEFQAKMIATRVKEIKLDKESKKIVASSFKHKRLKKVFLQNSMLQTEEARKG